MDAVDEILVFIPKCRECRSVSISDGWNCARESAHDDATSDTWSA